MSDVFSDVVGQPQVCDFLRRCVKTGRVTQSYLFVGPAGSGKTDAAYAFAKALLCPEHDEEGREICRKIDRHKHPDVHFYTPEGATGKYLVEQVRDIVADVSLAPIQADRKIYILNRVDQMPPSSANAFLKTLEEPPEDVVLILLGRTRESVLPTIVSRCQVVPFRTIPASAAAGYVVEKTAVGKDVARQALEACDGSIKRAIEFLASNERLAFRRSILDVMAALRNDDAWDIVLASRKLVELSKAPLDTVRARQEAELAENADFLARSAMRQIEARNKRAISLETRRSLRELTSIAGSFLRDVLMTCAGTPELVINTDMADAVADAAAHADEAHVAKALSAIGRCDTALNYNVSSETCIDAMFFEIREALYGSHSAC